jgi:fumarate hydratase class II
MRKFVPFVAVAALVAAAPVQAQSCDVSSTSASAVNCTVATTLSMTMPSIMKLTLGGTAVTLATPADIDAFNADGEDTTTTTGPTVDVRSNRSYRVQISSAATFSHTALSGAAQYLKPADELRWSVNGGTSSTPMSTTATDIASGSATNASTQKTVTYLTAYDITKDQPGAYSLAVTFTLVAP